MGWAVAFSLVGLVLATCLGFLLFVLVAWGTGHEHREYRCESYGVVKSAQISFGIRTTSWNTEGLIKTGVCP